MLFFTGSPAPKVIPLAVANTSSLKPPRSPAPFSIQPVAITPKQKLTVTVAPQNIAVSIAPAPARSPLPPGVMVANTMATNTMVTSGGNMITASAHGMSLGVGQPALSPRPVSMATQGVTMISKGYNGIERPVASAGSGVPVAQTRTVFSSETMPMATVPSLTMCNPTKGRVDSIAPSTVGAKRIKATVANIPVATSLMTIPSSPVCKSVPMSSGQTRPQTYKQMPRLAPIQPSIGSPRSPLVPSAPRSPYTKSHSVDSPKDVGVRQKRPLEHTLSEQGSETRTRTPEEKQFDRILGKAPPSKLIITDTSSSLTSANKDQSESGEPAPSTSLPNRTERTSKSTGNFQLGKVPEGKSAKKNDGRPGGQSGTRVEEHGGSPGRPSGNGVDGTSEEKPQRSCKGKLYKKILESSGMKKHQKKDKKVG